MRLSGSMRVRVGICGCVWVYVGACGARCGWQRDFSEVPGISGIPVVGAVPPTGVEPAHPPPEGGALSTELRGLAIAEPNCTQTAPRVHAQHAHTTNKVHSDCNLRVSVKELEP